MNKKEKSSSQKGELSIFNKKERAEARRRVVKYKNLSPWLLNNTNPIPLKFTYL